MSVLQVRSTLRNAKVILKEMLSKPDAAIRPPISSAAPTASSFSQPHVGMPAGIPAPLPPRGRPPPPPPPRVPSSLHGVPPANPSAVRAPAPQAARPYLQPYQPPPGGIRPGGAQGLHRQPYGQQDAQQQHYQPYQGGLEPYRMVRGVAGAGRGPAGQAPYAGPARGPASGLLLSASICQNLVSGVSSTWLLVELGLTAVAVLCAAYYRQLSVCGVYLLHCLVVHPMRNWGHCGNNQSLFSVTHSYLAKSRCCRQYSLQHC